MRETAICEHAPDSRWYVAQTQPRKERFAVLNLERQGYRVYLPEFARMVRHARRTQEVLRPLFPGYAFVMLDLAVDRWRPVRGTFGVASVIMEGDGPRPVPAGVVEELMAASNGAGWFDFRRELVPGQRVRFLSGPFADKLGRLVEMGDAARVGVLLDILGTERMVRSDARNLLPAEGE